jgi:hypothetical protein
MHWAYNEDKSLFCLANLILDVGAGFKKPDYEEFCQDGNRNAVLMCCSGRDGVAHSDLELFGVKTSSAALLWCL